MPLYRKDAFGFPKGLTFKPVFNLRPSFHAERAAESDRYGTITLPRHFHPAQATVIEIETDDFGNLVKVVARQAMTATLDVVYPFLVKDKLIKSVWINERNDAHNTLDKTKYSKP